MDNRIYLIDDRCNLLLFADVVEHLVEKSKPLLCFACELEFFSSTNYYNHLLRHVSQPKVVIKPLNSRLVHCLLAGEFQNKK